MFKRILNFFKKNLLATVALAVALGIALGQFMPLWFVRIFITFDGLFSSLLAFTVPLLILALITSAIVETDKGVGKMLIWTLSLSYVSTVIAGLFTFGVSDLVFPMIINEQVDSTVALAEGVSSAALVPYFKIDFPPLMDTMSALLLSFILGFAILKYNHHSIKSGVIELKDVVMMIINSIILPLLPIYIFGMFLKMTVSGEMNMVIKVYSKVILVMIVLFIVWLLIQYIIAGIIAKRNPFKSLRTMFPALFTALASSSSAATLPVTLRCANKMGVRPNVVNFVIPMCANIHLSGASIRTVALAVATMLMYGVTYNFSLYFVFIMIFSITVLAAPGIPGGVIMAAAGMIQSMLGFTDPMIAIMITLSIALDSLGTAVNVTGDGALMLIVNKVTAEDAGDDSLKAAGVEN